MGASIILNPWIVGSKGLSANSVYSATETAVRSFARTWTTDLPPHSPEFSEPGSIDTPGLIVVRKNSIRARKTMEMLSFTSLVSSLPDCRNPGASCDPITIFLVRTAFLRTWVCAMLDRVSSCPLGFTLAWLLRPSRW